MGDIGLLSAGVFSSCALIYSAPAALPKQKIWGSTADAFMISLVLSGAFLLTDGVWMLACSLWGISYAVLLCAVSAFAFSSALSCALMPDADTVSAAASALVLTLVQPRFSSFGESVLSSVGTALGIIILLTALSPVLRRLSLSDAPRSMKGLPSILLILAIAALAFAGF